MVTAHLSDWTPRTGRSLPFRSASAILKQKNIHVGGTRYTSDWGGGGGEGKSKNGEHCKSKLSL
jgi:hypothetical protein